MTAILTPSQVGDGEQIFTLDGVDWDQYVAINDALPDRAGLRMIYLDGSLTLLTLSRRHDWYEDQLDEIVKAICLGCGIDWEIAGSATFRVEEINAGLEGDRTCYFGAHAEMMRGPTDIDLSIQPPPDLAIEVEVSHNANKVVKIYERLGVPELWRFNVKKKTLSIWVLGENQTYASADRSRALPKVGLEDILGQLKIAEELNSTPRWLRQLQDWVRATLVPRMGQ